MDIDENSQVDQIAQQVIALERIAKTKMSKEAISRYGNLKMGHTETAIKAIALIAQAVQTGQIREVLSDEEFKLILLEIQKGKTNFRFKK
jgi:DNA-binding TFAR19-related protein (PDSD5 family)